MRTVSPDPSPSLAGSIDDALANLVRLLARQAAREFLNTNLAPCNRAGIDAATKRLGRDPRQATGEKA